LQGNEDIGVNVNGELRVQESGEGGLGVDGESTGLLNVSTDRGTNGDGRQSGVGDSTDLDEAADVGAVAPAEDGGLEGSLESTLGGVQPSNEGSLDISVQAGDDATGSTNAETGLDVGTKAKVSVNIQESRKRSLSRGAQNESRGELGGREDTINGNIDGLLGSDVGTGRDVDRQGSNNLGIQGSRAGALTPSKQGSLQGSGNVGLASQPHLQLSTSIGVNNASSASQSTSLQSSSAVSAQASEDGDGTVNIHAEQGINQANDIGGSITEQVG
jgi:hypothetical protein